MQTHRGHLSDADRADPTVTAYLTAMATVRRLEAELSDARAIADAYAAVMEVGAGEARGRLKRVARVLGMEEQSAQNQRQRGKNPRHAAPQGIRRRVLTDDEYDTVLRRADAEAHHQVPGQPWTPSCAVRSPPSACSPPRRRRTPTRAPRSARTPRASGGSARKSPTTKTRTTPPATSGWTDDHPAPSPPARSAARRKRTEQGAPGAPRHLDGGALPRSRPQASAPPAEAAESCNSACS